MATRLWKFLNTDIRELVSIDTAKGAIEAADASLDLAKTLNKDEVQQLLPLLQEGDSLIEALNSPLAELAESTVPFLKIATSLLKFYLKKTQHEPTLAQAVTMVSQAAYLESFRSYVLLSKQPKVQSWLRHVGGQSASEAVKQQFQQLEKLELDDKDIRLAIVFFHESKLARAFNEILTARLVQLGIQPEVAAQIVDRVARNTDPQILPALAEAGSSVQRLVEWYRLGGREVLEKYLSIDSYLEERIQPRPDEPVFNEQFSFRDIYVPLMAQPLKDGEPDKDQPPIAIEQWAKNLLSDHGKSDGLRPSCAHRVMFIQGGPGRGKSVFCRMFADWVRENLHPSWTPILIRLRDVRTLEKDFEETLRGAVDKDFAKNDPGWLTDRNIRFLFLLDGFDELLMEGRTSGGLEEFLRQVGRFQESCAGNSEKGHRVLITGRSLSLQSIERMMPSNLERVEILPMDDEIQNQWLAKWGELIDADLTHLKEILRDPRLPERVDELAREPLLLYLLAAMHRDGELRLEMFEGANEASAKVLIYEKTLDWVLNKQRPDLLNRDLTEMETEGLRRILAEAGLCVVQSGGECASIATIENRLKNDDNARNLLEQARDRLKDSPIRNALAAFYMQQGKGGSGSVEFVHKSFSEFLCAERLKEAIEDWSKPGVRRGDPYLVTEKQMDWEIYDLLGYGNQNGGGLTIEIVGYLMALLDKSLEFEPVLLFQRLESFYDRWCGGEFIDSFPENLPQKKMMQLQGLHEPPGLRQVDVFAGLNTLILLLELNRYINKQNLPGEKPDFYPSQRIDDALPHNYKSVALIHTIGYSHCVWNNFFRSVVGPFLGDANYSRSWLRRVDFEYAKLQNADFSYSVLTDASFAGTDLEGAKFDAAHLKGISWNEDTNWKNVQGLERAIDVPEALKKQLGLE